MADIHQIFPNSEPAEHADLEYAPGSPLAIDGPTELEKVGIEVISTEGGPNVYQLWQDTRGPEAEEGRELSEEEKTRREYEFNVPAHLTKGWPVVSMPDKPRLAYAIRGITSAGEPKYVQVGYLHTEGPEEHAEENEPQETTGN